MQQLQWTKSICRLKRSSRVQNEGQKGVYQQQFSYHKSQDGMHELSCGAGKQDVYSGAGNCTLSSLATATLPLQCPRQGVGELV